MTDAVPSISDISLELSREARGVQVWLPLRAYGADAFTSHLDWCLDSARWLAETIAEEAAALRVMALPTLNVVNLSFDRYVGGVSQSLVSTSEMVAWLTLEINARGRVLVAPTRVRGEACLRVCVLSCATTPEHLRSLRKDILQAETVVLDATSCLEAARRNPGRALGFRVPYRVELRPERGLCVLAEQSIAEGETVWRFEEGACLPVSEASVAALREERGEQHLGEYLNKCFPWDGQLWSPQGDTQFFNTSAEPSIRPAGDGVTWVATRPIAAGEEITDDYSTYDNGTFPWYEALCDELCVDSAITAAQKYNRAANGVEVRTAAPALVKMAPALVPSSTAAPTRQPHLHDLVGDESQPGTLGGIGVKAVALKAIAPGTTIFTETGPVFSQPSMHSIQIGVAAHCEITGEGRFVAHSFTPNVAVKVVPDSEHPIQFRALRVIPQGEQLAFDYTTTEWELESGGFVDFATRTPVRGFRHLGDERQRELLAAGLLPAHILELWEV